MHGENDGIEILKSKENFQTWSERSYITDEIRESIAQASILLVPLEGFRGVATPNFPPFTEEILYYFKNNVTDGYKVDICASDESFALLSLNSDYKRLGKFVVKKVAVPAFLILLTGYINLKISKEQDSKPQIVINNIINSELPVSQINPIAKSKPKIKEHLPHKYLEPSMVTFSITVVDSTGKSLDFHYTGSVKDIDIVTEKVKNAFLDGN